MDKFEKLAIQYENAGKIMINKEVGKLLEKKGWGAAYQAMSAALKNEPDAMRQLVALNKEIDVSEVDNLPQDELSKAATIVFFQFAAPFVVD